MDSGRAVKVPPNCPRPGFQCAGHPAYRLIIGGTWVFRGFSSLSALNAPFWRVPYPTFSFSTMFIFSNRLLPTNCNKFTDKIWLAHLLLILFRTFSGQESPPGFPRRAFPAGLSPPCPSACPRHPGRGRNSFAVPPKKSIVVFCVFINESHQFVEWYRKILV